MYKTRNFVHREFCIRPDRIPCPPHVARKGNFTRTMWSQSGLGRTCSRRSKNEVGKMENGTDETTKYKNSPMLQAKPLRSSHQSRTRMEWELRNFKIQDGFWDRSFCGGRIVLRWIATNRATSWEMTTLSVRSKGNNFSIIRSWVICFSFAYAN